MAGNPDWKKAQCERLEEERKTELGLRSTWWAVQRAKWEDEEKKKEAERWTWGSWWWAKRDWSQEDRSGSSGARGSQEPPPEPTAEPTASSTPLAIEDFTYPTRNPGEDLTALRAATMTPVSFMPQRHVMMALGRPVVVLSGI